MPWQDQLIPAAFRGVPFLWRDMRLEGGRRLAAFEFPQRESGFVEDLGRRIRRYPVRAYVLGDDYFAQREALLAALESDDGAGQLDHPYRGKITVAVERFTLGEAQEEGRLASFEIGFIEAGPPPSPLAADDTAGAVDDAASATFNQLAASFTADFDIANVESFVAGAAADAVALAHAALLPLLGIANLDLSSVAPLIAGIVPSFALGAVSLAAQVTQTFATYADAVTALLGLFTPSGPTETSSRGLPPVADPSYGLAAVAAFGSSFAGIAATTPSRAIEARNQAALVALVAGSAVAAIATLYASTQFASLTDAEAARDQITGLIDDQALAASDAGDDAAAAAWEALYAAAAIDLTARGKQLPNVITLQAAASLPSLRLAQRLYQDATRAPELVARNAAPHPLFMPLAVEALAA